VIASTRTVFSFTQEACAEAARRGDGLSDHLGADPPPAAHNRLSEAIKESAGWTVLVPTPRAKHLTRWAFSSKDRNKSHEGSDVASTELTAVEQQVLLAALRLHPNGYGVSIRDEIERQTGSAPSFGTIYTILDRLASKGFLKSRQGEATAERGGRAKLYFMITAPGQTTLRHSLVSLDALRRGTTLAAAGRVIVAGASA
jgi:DNA-binding PadR family transcriptional regulator